MTQTERLTPERAARLLRAKAGELENMAGVFLERINRPMPVTADARVFDEAIGNLMADIALVAGLLAHEIERNEAMRHVHTKTGKVMTDADFEKLADEAEQGYDVSDLLARSEAAREAARHRTVDDG